MNRFAWIFATSPNGTVRDGKRAVELATKACELTEHKDPNLIDTLAAACAETGDFESAVKWAEKALELATNAPLRAEITQHLENFRSGKPWRDLPQPKP